ncbi:acyl-CoA thioesterase [Desulfosudis oleivorans]|uniref:Thioesterase superfamily protein n=1 Tax=Desulfosudis oleivorans (strain DSM 6200 / JCM 39069 / Hxd3) TaxID=96561 RepID=A8ZZA9_DESOH|nr:acyl-CoA thioesterase [Desulfosudis oleivorans]ABW67262.1 thioesterase superfamily protein [Desulfosudis oleivorans Hxd3]
MNGKTVRQTHCTMASVMEPADANPAGLVHGGVVMKLIDNAAGVVAVRHSQTVCVTASIDRLDFHNPVFIGNLLVVKAGLNLVGKSSMEVGVRVECEDVLTGKVTHTASAYLTFVALGPDFKPVTEPLPSLVLETDDEKRRNREALRRREVRLAEKTREKACQTNAGQCEI